ncbi:MAG: sulfite exporter TauE/SafE family protein [Candidatus Poseidoniaceae archaeon]|nr:sulfite exporter TauE/SafE family protein [Candidatus Poseidoniaceae archaeon]MDP7203753.1 sulfite exporter TauE/SafE family protein [Candidatus Poseidoniaceae archaeon]
MDPYSITAAVLILLVALTFSPLGLGGGVLYLPILLYIAEWPVTQAIIGSLSMVWMVAIGSSMAHTKDGHSDIRIAKAGRITAVPGAVVGTIIAWLILEYISDVVIKVIAAGILVFVIERNLRTPVISTKSTEDLSTYKVGTALGGIASGVLGIGGGSIYVTLHRSILGLETRTSAGTSYLIGAMVVPVALFSHIIIDQSLFEVVETAGWATIIAMPIMAFSAAFFGARFAIKYLPVKMVTTTFLLAVSLSLGRYLWDIGGMIL